MESLTGVDVGEHKTHSIELSNTGALTDVDKWPIFKRVSLSYLIHAIICLSHFVTGKIHEKHPHG